MHRTNSEDVVQHGPSSQCTEQLSRESIIKIKQTPRATALEESSSPDLHWGDSTEWAQAKRTKWPKNPNMEYSAEDSRLSLTPSCTNGQALIYLLFADFLPLIQSPNQGFTWLWHMDLLFCIPSFYYLDFHQLKISYWWLAIPKHFFWTNILFSSTRWDILQPLEFSHVLGAPFLPNTLRSVSLSMCILLKLQTSVSIYPLRVCSILCLKQCHGLLWRHKMDLPCHFVITLYILCNFPQTPRCIWTEIYIYMKLICQEIHGMWTLTIFNKWITKCSKKKNFPSYQNLRN